eukprot:scaffold310435_cov22-Tisochrysis_lutea.AAC.1
MMYRMNSTAVHPVHLKISWHDIFKCTHPPDPSPQMAPDLAAIYHAKSVDTSSFSNQNNNKLYAFYP